MFELSVRGSWYGGGCRIYDSATHGDYASLGTVSGTGYTLNNLGANGSCGGYKFNVTNDATGAVIYTSTSDVQSVSLFFDGKPPPNIQYDCINGACLPKTTYNTPGIYQSLADCEVACGTGCSGKCISNADWAQIEGLSNELKTINCS